MRVTKITRIVVALVLLLGLADGQIVNGRGTKEQETQTSTVSGTVLRFNDSLGTQTNSFEMIVSGGPATVTVTIDGCMRGGKCNTGIGSTSATTNTIINLSMTSGPYDFYNVNTAFTGGSNPTLTFNRTGTVARSSSATGGGTTTIASGTAALGTGAITSATCATVVTVAATGVATTDDIMADFNADPTGVVGYQASASGMLTIVKYPTTNNVNFKVCNNTAGSITPGAITLNWRVVR